MSYFTPTKIAVGGKALLDQWRRERQLALRGSSEPPEPEIEHDTRSSPDNLEPDLSPTDMGRSGTRPPALVSPLKKSEATPMATSALPEVTMPSMTKLGRFIESEPDKRASYDGHDSDNANSVHGRDNGDSAHGEASQDEQSGAASHSETKPDDAPSSADNQTAVKNHTTANGPAIWDPPFSPPLQTHGATLRSSKRPTQHRRSSLRRSVRQASPVATAIRENQDGEDGAQDPQTKRYKFSSIKDHRPSSPLNPNLFELLICWSLPPGVKSDVSVDDLETWEPEENIHSDAPRAVFAYWKNIGGREAHMTDPNLWHIAAVKKHRVLRGIVQMFVSWVGSGDDSWEPEEIVAESAQEILNEYWEARGGRENCLGETVAKKRKTSPTVVKKGTARKTHR